MSIRYQDVKHSFTLWNKKQNMKNFNIKIQKPGDKLKKENHHFKEDGYVNKIELSYLLLMEGNVTTTTNDLVGVLIWFSKKVSSF